MSAITYLVFHVLPAADPAALRAGHAADRNWSRRSLRTSASTTVYVQCFDDVERIIPHADFGCPYENDTEVLALSGAACSTVPR